MFLTKCERDVISVDRLTGCGLCHFQVCDLHEGKSYVFRVRAVNASGVGKPSDASEPVLLEARPGERGRPAELPGVEGTLSVDESGSSFVQLYLKILTRRYFSIDF